MDEMASEVHFSEEKAQKAMIDAARLADELRAEQEIAMMLERDRKLAAGGPGRGHRCGFKIFFFHEREN
jgi:hypothetical protein